MNNDELVVNNFLKSSIQFSGKLSIDPDYEFNRVHRRRLASTQKINSNTN